MKLITLGQLRDHAKADGDDDDLLIVYGESAEGICARLANRGLFATESELMAAIVGVPVAMATAYVDYDAAVAIANTQDDSRISTMMLAQAQVRLDASSRNAEATINGISAEKFPDIVSAVLLIANTLYRNRENVVSGQGAAAIEVPMSARSIMADLRWIGSQLP